MPFMISEIDSAGQISSLPGQNFKLGRIYFNFNMANFYVQQASYQVQQAIIVSSAG